LALAVFAAPAQATILGPRGGHSPNADDIRTAYWVALVVAVLIIIAVHTFLLAALFRFRARRGRTPRRFAAGPGAFLRPTVPLALVAVSLFVFGIVMTSKTRQVQPTEPDGLRAQSGLVAQVNGFSVPSDAKPLDINVIGQQWIWRFEYPGGRPGNKVFSYNELVVPEHTTVILHVTSTDVTHRWFIPALDGQVDAVPGRTSETWFRADRTGIYPGQSSSYSGTSYAAMRAWVKVVSPQRYEQFVKQKRKQLAAAQNFVQKTVQKQAAPAEAIP
jgi:cytochrome c oxidase subunit II